MRTQGSNISYEIRYYSLTRELWLLLPDGTMEIYRDVPERFWKVYRKAKKFSERDNIINFDLRVNFKFKTEKRTFPNYEILKRK